MKNKVSDRIERAITSYKGCKSQAEIARAVGFASPNMLSMIKSGKARLPLKRVPALCAELGIPFEEHFVLVLEQDFSDDQTNPLWNLFGGRHPTLSELRALARG